MPFREKLEHSHKIELTSRHILRLGKELLNFSPQTSCFGSSIGFSLPITTNTTFFNDFSIVITIFDWMITPDYDQGFNGGE